MREGQSASYVGTERAVAVNSGTAALHIALFICGIAKGNEVITTPFTFIATTNPIAFCRAKPVFVDVLENTFNLSMRIRPLYPLKRRMVFWCN